MLFTQNWSSVVISYPDSSMSSLDIWLESIEVIYHLETVDYIIVFTSWESQ